MHHLHLLRHAKSDRDQPVEDKERLLSRRGREAARQVGQTLPAAIGMPDLVLCSSAVRTRETAVLVLHGYASPPSVRYEDALYLAGMAALLRRLRQLAEEARSVLLIGHNPGLHELAVTLAAPQSPRYRDLADGKFPTAARASLAIEGSWAGLDRGRNALIDYVIPKSLG